MSKRIIFIFALLFTVPSFAQDSAENLAFRKKVIMDSLDAVYSNLSLGQEILIPSSDSMGDEWRRFTIEYNKRVFNWQYASSIILFFIVITIVATGLLLSYMQFRKGWKIITDAVPNAIPTRNNVEGDRKNEDDNTGIRVMAAQMEFGKEGFKINTSVIGLVILLISLSFFFFYLRYVYPINVTPSSPTQVEQVER